MRGLRSSYFLSCVLTCLERGLQAFAGAIKSLLCLFNDRVVLFDQILNLSMAALLVALVQRVEANLGEANAQKERA